MSPVIPVLITEKLVEGAEDGELSGKVARRPGTRVARATPKGYFLGIDLGRLFIKATISDANYRILEADFIRV